METEKTFSRGIRWTSKSAFVSLATQLGQLAVISKLLQPHDLGVFAVVTIIYSLMLIFSDLGMSNLLVQTKNLSSALINTSLLACSVFGVIMAALLLIVGSLISTYFGMVELELLMPLLAMIALVNPYIQIHSALLQREGRFQFLAHLDTWAAIIAFAVVWLGAVFHPGPECLVLGLISATCFRFLRLSTRTNKLHALSSKFSASSIAPHLRFFTFQLLDRLVSFSSGSVDKLIIGRALGGEALGRYSLASQLAMKPYSILGPVLSRVSLPTLAHGGQTDEEIAKLYLVVVRLAFLLAFPTYIFMYIVGPIAITQLIGEKWAIVAQLLPILSIAGFLYSIGHPIGALLIARGRVGWSLWFNIFGLTCYAVTYLLVSPRGVSAIAFGLVLVTCCIMLPLEFWLRWKLIGMSAFEYIKGISGSLLAAAVSTAFLELCMIAFTANNNIVPRLIFSTLSVAVFFAIIAVRDKDSLTLFYKTFISLER